MIPFEVDMPEFRQETRPPTPQTGGTVAYYRPSDPAIAVEFDDFLHLLPMLRTTHGGQYVAVCGGQVIASGLYVDTVLRLAEQVVAGRLFYCGWVEPLEGDVFQSGKVEILPDAEAA